MDRMNTHEQALAAAEPDALERTLDRSYQAGFITEIETETIPPGLDEDVVRRI